MNKFKKFTFKYVSDLEAENRRLHTISNKMEEEFDKMLAFYQKREDYFEEMIKELKDKLDEEIKKINELVAENLILKERLNEANKKIEKKEKWKDSVLANRDK